MLLNAWLGWVQVCSPRDKTASRRYEEAQEDTEGNSQSLLYKDTGSKRQLIDLVRLEDWGVRKGFTQGMSLAKIGCAPSPRHVSCSDTSKIETSDSSALFSGLTSVTINTNTLATPPNKQRKSQKNQQRRENQRIGNHAREFCTTSKSENQRKANLK